MAANPYGMKTYGANKSRAYSPDDPFQGGFAAGSQGMLRGAGQAGYFDPTGSDQFRRTARRRLLTQGRSRRNRMGNLARLAGLDRMGQRQAMIDTEQDIAGSTAGALNDFDFNEYGQNRDFFRGMLGQERGYEEEARREREARKAQDGGFWGDLLGTGLGIATRYLPRRK